MSLIVRSKLIPLDPIVLFWLKVEKVFGQIPKLIRMILEFNGFDSYLALKGIQWDDKKYFFEALEESITSLSDLDDNDDFKIKMKNELAINNQSIEKFKLKLGHKNLIINLCNELQKTNFEDFNASYMLQTIPDNQNRQSTSLVVRKQPDEEHGYSREDEIESKPKRLKLESTSSQSNQYQETAESAEVYEQYIYETEEEDQYLEGSDYVDESTEIVEYQEDSAYQDNDSDNIYCAEQIVKQEADNFEQTESYAVSNFDHVQKSRYRAPARSGNKHSKKPQHMYNSEFLQAQNGSGRIGTPGRRRPKIQKNYPDTEEGMLERWADLVRQSCEVIVPHDMLAGYDLSVIEIIKISKFIWEVSCPLCGKKLRLQLTHEGKYINFKRSNFERHLRIVHFKQIAKTIEMSEEHHQDQEAVTILEEVLPDENISL